MKPFFSTQFLYWHVVCITIPFIDLTLFIYLNKMPSFLEEYAWNVDEKNIMTRYHKCNFVGKNQNPILIKEISCWCEFWDSFLIILFVILVLHLMSILICHMCHNQQTPYIWDFKNWTIHYFLTLFSIIPCIWASFLENHISVCNNQFQILIFQVHS